MKSQSETIQTVSALKLPMLKTRDHDLWSMRMKQYLTHTDYALWEVIVNGDVPASIASVSGGAEAFIPPKTTEQKIVRRNELKAKSGHVYHKGEEIHKENRKELNFNGKETVGFDKTKVERYSYHRRGLESLEARIVVHQKNEVVFEEDIAFLKYDVKVRDNSITELKNQLEETLKEKYDLKLKLEKFKTSLKNLSNLINSQISPKDKTGLGYDSQLNERGLNNKSNVFESASDSSVNESEEDNNQANDRYKAGEGYHAVPPSYTGNFIPLKPNLSFAGLDDSVFKSAISKTVTSVHDTEISASKNSKEIMEKPKSVRPSAPISEDWESDSDDNYEIRPSIK
nr:ribonuclease H-like domain-containing protein [Tanacetum cinerariifolium]